MKTNQLKNNRINILFYLTAILFLPFIVNAQFRVSTGGGATVGDTTSNATGLKVYGGDINLKDSSKTFQINGNKVLWCNGHIENIFAGVGAGATTTGLYNTALGYQSLNTNTTGTSNTAVGELSLNKNTASGNCAFGHATLYTNTTGTLNCAFGDSSLYLNTGTANTAYGTQALKTNGVSSNNTAVGYKALYANTLNGGNSAFGNAALTKNTGAFNTGVGYQALLNTTVGTSGAGYNTAIGASAGSAITTGVNNTCVGYNANLNAGTYSNATAIGNGASATATNYMAIGNTSVGTIAGPVTFTTYSDQRVKNNIQENVPGLLFIKKLRPVTYNYDIDKENQIMDIKDDSIVSPGKYDIQQITFSGFLAQEVEQAAQSINYNFSGVDKPKNSKSLYGLRYSEFVVPIVKAIQEQQKIIQKQDSLITKQDSINKALQDQINQCCSKAGNRSNNNVSGDNKGIGVINVELNNADVVVLNEAVPNPFAEQTVITFNIPSNFNTSQMLFYDSNGKLIKSVDIKTAGKGQLNVFANDLSNGTYSYTLVVDGKIIATKRMIRQQ